MVGLFLVTLIVLISIPVFLFVEKFANIILILYSLLAGMGWLGVFSAGIIILISLYFLVYILDDYLDDISHIIVPLLSIFLLFLFFSTNKIYFFTSFPTAHANKELIAYANIIDVQHGACASDSEEGSMFPCVVKMDDESLLQVYCPWKPWLHGCILDDAWERSSDVKKLTFEDLVKLEVSALAENKTGSETFNNNFQDSNIANFANKVSDNASQQGSQNIYTHEQKQDLAAAAAEIQRLLKQLEMNNPTATDSEKVAYVDGETTPNFKHRVVKALLAGGESAIEEFFDNSYVKVAKAVLKSWIESNK